MVAGIISLQPNSSWLCTFLFSLSALLVAASASAQTSYPDKPIRIVVQFPPDIPVDTIVRLLGQELVKVWGKPVVIHNVTGAEGSIAADCVAKATPDGYTLGLLSQTQLVTTPSLHAQTYHPVKDFAPISAYALKI